MEPWTHAREFVSRHVAPINTVVFCTTGIVIPLFDFVRPRGPYLIVAATLMGSLFIAALIVVRWKQWVRMPTALLVGLGLSAALFTVGAAASYEHAERGGVLVSTLPSLQPLQDVLTGMRLDVQATNRTLGQQGKVLADIRSGKSDDPRVALRNMGISWEYANFQNASLRGDLRVMELFLAGGMPAGLPHSDTLAYVFVRANSPHSAEQLALLDRYGIDLHGPAAVTQANGSTLPPTLYIVATSAGNADAQKYLLAHGSAIHEYESWMVDQKKRPRESGYWM